MSQEIEERAAGYVLGTLAGEERESFEMQMRKDRTLAEMVAQWEQRLQPLADTVGEVQPPQQVWRNIEQRLGFEDSVRQHSFWDNLRLWQGISAVATAFGIWFAFLVINMAPQGPELLYLVQDQGKTEWIVRASYQQPRVEIEAVEPPHLPQGQVCQLWLTLPDGSVRLVAELPHSGEVSVPLFGDINRLLSPGTMLSVTVESAEEKMDRIPSDTMVSQGRWIRI